MFYLHVLARFYQPREKLGFVGCFQPFIHILPCTTLLNSEECALSEKNKKKDCDYDTMPLRNTVLLLNQLRACIIYSHLHVTLNSYHDWELLLNILVPAIRQKSTSRLIHFRFVTIRLARFLLLSNLWLWLRLYICVLYFLFNCMLVVFSHFGYNEINMHTHTRYGKR